MDFESRLATTALGSTVTLSPETLEVSLPDFQTVVRELRLLERKGVVSTKEHKESQSGNDYIDLVMVTKLQDLD